MDRRLDKLDFDRRGVCEFAGDQGYTMTLEALGPPLTGGLRPLFFFDSGSARLLGKGSETVNKDSAASIGTGLRWNWERRLDVSADLSYVLNGIASTGTIPGTKAGDAKLMLTAFYRF